MVANKVYEELKMAKGDDKSFSEVITEALEKSGNKVKTIGDVLKHAGALKGDKESDEVTKWTKMMWKRWEKKVRRELS